MENKAPLTIRKYSTLPHCVQHHLIKHTKKKWVYVEGLMYCKSEQYVLRWQTQNSTQNFTPKKNQCTSYTCRFLVISVAIYSFLVNFIALKCIFLQFFFLKSANELKHIHIKTFSVLTTASFPFEWNVQRMFAFSFGLSNCLLVFVVQKNKWKGKYNSIIA